MALITLRFTRANTLVIQNIAFWTDAADFPVLQLLDRYFVRLVVRLAGCTAVVFNDSESFVRHFLRVVRSSIVTLVEETVNSFVV